jgi:hypothetical protein
LFGLLPFFIKLSKKDIIFRNLINFIIFRLVFFTISSYFFNDNTSASRYLTNPGRISSKTYDTGLYGRSGGKMRTQKRQRNQKRERRERTQKHQRTQKRGRTQRKQRTQKRHRY